MATTAGRYGRGEVAKAKKKGRSDTGSAYEYGGSRAATSYLRGDEGSAYQQALDVLGSTPSMKKSGKLRKGGTTAIKHQDAIQRASRLRDVASNRALGAFERASTQHSKPWLQRASEGLISGRSARHSLANLQQFGGEGVRHTGRTSRRAALMGEHEFEGLGIEQARQTRGKLRSLAQGNFDPSLIGDPGVREEIALGRPQGSIGMEYGPGRAGGRTAEWRGGAGTTDISDAERAYSGLAGGARQEYQYDVAPPPPASAARNRWGGVGSGFVAAPESVNYGRVSGLSTMDRYGRTPEEQDIYEAGKKKKGKGPFGLF